MVTTTELNYATPDPRNYQIGKAQVYFTGVEHGAVRRHVGNVSQAEITLKVQTLDHYSSMTGVKTKDLTIITEKAAEIKMALEEWTPANLALALVGMETVDTAGDFEIEILSENMRFGKLELIGMNDIGPRWDYILNKVGIKPAAALAAISDQWGKIELMAEVFAVAGVFGHAKMRQLSTESELRVEG